MSKKDKKKNENAEETFVPASDVFMKKSQLKELIRYLIVGCSVTLITLVLIAIFNKIFGEDYYDLSNALACFIMIFGAFPPYKLFVFRSRDWSLTVTKREFIGFFSARVFSYIFDAAFIWLTVRILQCNKEYPLTIARRAAESGELFWEKSFILHEEWIFKFISMAVTTVANYIFSKFVIFKKKTKE